MSKYYPAPGGRIEIRFKDREDKDLTDSIIKDIKRKTGMTPDKIMLNAMIKFNNTFDDKGNII